MTVAAIILAAGMSTRMGSLKQLLPWGNSTILGSTIDLYAAAGVDKIIVVVGYCAEKIIDVLQAKPVEWVLNRDYPSGMASSLRMGIKALGKDDDACLLGLGDTPLLKIATIKSIVKAYCQHKNKIIVPVYKGRSGHPVLVGNRFYSELSAVKGDIGARVLLKNYEKEVHRLEVKDEGVIIDIDKPENYRAYYERFGGETAWMKLRSL